MQLIYFFYLIALAVTVFLLRHLQDTKGASTLPSAWIQGEDLALWLRICRWKVGWWGVTKIHKNIYSRTREQTRDCAWLTFTETPPQMNVKVALCHVSRPNQLRSDETFRACFYCPHYFFFFLLLCYVHWPHVISSIALVNAALTSSWMDGKDRKDFHVYNLRALTDHPAV